MVFLQSEMIKHAENNSFGLVALCSISYVLAVLLLRFRARSGTGSVSVSIFLDFFNFEEEIMYIAFVNI